MSTSMASQPLLVYIADDDDEMRISVGEILRADGCATREARDGEELLGLLKLVRTDPELWPDVIVTDVKMPRLSGLGVLAAMRRDGWRLPTVMITAVPDTSIRTVAKHLGAVGVLHKPFDPNDLLLAVRNTKAAHDLGR
jgi:CheY-like chemotaxis protein